MKNIVEVKRKTTESKMVVNIDFNSLAPDYRAKIDTPYPFLNHMIEHIAYRAGITISTSVSLNTFVLSHVVFEDLGIAFGKALKSYINENSKFGIYGFGDGVGIIDEAYATSAISFEDRAYFDFYTDCQFPEVIEDVKTEDLIVFLEGMAQGGLATLHINLLKGTNGHHIFEAIFRSIGVTLKKVLEVDKTRSNLTSGVAGKIEFEISNN
jgi:imidazoleglycerol-phosphate dehydratase